MEPNPSKKYKSSNKNISIRKIPNTKAQSFFGYYGKTPWNSDETLFLFCEIGFIDREPTKKDLLKLGFINLKTNKKTYFAKSCAWNWQQGCMLKWMPNNKNKVIFNSRANGRLISLIKDLKTKKEEIIPWPVYDVHPNGKRGVSLSFSRLYNIRKSYGYESKDIFQKEKHPKREGIFLIDFKKKKRKLLISLDELSKYKPLQSMSFGDHWVNHVEFSPSGEKICFFHRWKVPGSMHYTRLFSLDINTKELFLFPDSGFYSHMCWKDNEHIFGWSMLPGKIGNIRKNNAKAKIIFKFILPIYRKLVPKSIKKRVVPAGYFLFTDKSEIIKKWPIYSEDGHPCFSPDRKYIITDIYPNKEHFRKLILYDIEKNKITILGEFLSLPDKKYSKDSNWDTSGMRCDLHPRWSPDGKKISIDSVHEGKRGMYIINIENLLDD